MGNSSEKIRSLVENVSRGTLLVPEMQRRYVWRSTQVRDLFDSLYRGYPVGSILIWNRADGDITGRVMDVGESAGEVKKGETQLLLDGQQRLTALTSILKDKELLVRWRKKSVDILFNVNHPDIDENEVLDAEEDNEDDDEAIEDSNDSLDFEKKTFVVSTRRLLSQPNWVSLRRVFREGAADIWLEVIDRMNLEPKSPEAKKILNRIQQLQKIADIEMPIVTLGKEMDYRTVTDVFCRVNSAGARLRGSDLALAQLPRAGSVPSRSSRIFRTVIAVRRSNRCLISALSFAPLLFSAQASASSSPSVQSQSSVWKKAGKKQRRRWKRRLTSSGTAGTSSHFRFCRLPPW